MSVNISETVKKYREDNKLSLRKFSEKADLKTATVRKIEKGFTHVQGETLVKLHKAMGMEPPAGLSDTSKPSKARTKFRAAEFEPWMEFKQQKTYSPVVIDLMEELRGRPDKKPLISTLAELGYSNLQSARNSLRSIGKKYDFAMVKVAQRNNELYIFKIAKSK